MEQWQYSDRFRIYVALLFPGLLISSAIIYVLRQSRRDSVQTIVDGADRMELLRMALGQPQSPGLGDSEIEQVSVMAVRRLSRLGDVEALETASHGAKSEAVKGLAQQELMLISRPGRRASDAEQESSEGHAVRWGGVPEQVPMANHQIETEPSSVRQHGESTAHALLRAVDALDKGLITREEYDRIKSMLLNQGL